MMKPWFALAMVVSALAWAQAPSRRDVVPGRYIVQFKDSPQTADHQKSVQQQIESHGGRVVTTLTNVMKALVVEADEKTIAKVKKMPGVASVKADRVIKHTPVPQDPDH